MFNPNHFLGITYLPINGLNGPAAPAGAISVSIVSSLDECQATCTADPTCVMFFAQGPICAMLKSGFDLYVLRNIAIIN